MGYKLLFIFLLYVSYSTAYYENSEHVRTITPLDLFNLRNVANDEIWIIQYYNKSDPEMVIAANDFEMISKTMVSYVKAGAINIEYNTLATYLLHTTTFPAYQLYTYYKYLPELTRKFESSEDIYDEVAKQISRIFEENNVHRFVESRWNYELGITDVDSKLNKSLVPWGVVFYDSKCGKCIEFSKVWNEVVLKLHEKIVFGSINNPTFHVIERNDIEYPVIKYYPRGNKHVNLPETYEGKLEYGPIHDFFSDRIKATKVNQIVNVASVRPCLKRTICVFFFMPTLDVCNASCRLDAIAEIKSQAKRFKHRSWIWMWTEFEQQPDLERIFSVAKTEYPVVVALNVYASMFMKKELPNALTESDFGKISDGIGENKDFTNVVAVKQIPDIKIIRPWVPSGVKDEL